MFKFLKDKIKDVVSKFSKSVEEEAPPKVEEKKQEVKPAKPVAEKKDVPKKEKAPEKKKHEPKKEPEKVAEEKAAPKEENVVEKKEGFFSKLKDKFTKTEEVVQETKEEPVEEKKGFFQAVTEKITTTKISAEKFDKLFGDLELVMLENNVALEVVDKIKEGLQKTIVDKPIKRGRVEDEIQSALKQSILNVFDTEPINILEMAQKKKPLIIVFFGQNGTGKTTSIAKVAHLLKKNKLSVAMAAGDTFRAASIHQLKEWGEKVDVPVIAHDYGSDPAAVAFDGVKFCEAHKTDVLLIDTAGRQHSNADLMRQMEKIVRVAKPDLKIFVGESIVGNDAIEQVENFKKTVGIDGIILTKADVDEKGGTMISIGYVTGKPIIYLGCGQNLDDLKEFDKESIVKNLGL